MFQDILPSSVHINFSLLIPKMCFIAFFLYTSINQTKVTKVTKVMFCFFSFFYSGRRPQPLISFFLIGT